MAEDIMDDELEDLEDPEDQEEEEGQGSSLVKYLILGVIALLLVSGAVLGYLYFTGDSDDAMEEEVAEESTEKNKNAVKKNTEPKAPLQYMPMSPAFVVNFSGDEMGRFLQVSLEVGARDPSALEGVREHMPLIRNNLVLLFGSQNPDELATRAGKEKLREELLQEVRGVLKSETGNAGVDGIFFTSFVMQ